MYGLRALGWYTRGDIAKNHPGDHSEYCLSDIQPEQLVGLKEWYREKSHLGLIIGECGRLLSC